MNNTALHHPIDRFAIDPYAIAPVANTNRGYSPTTQLRHAVLARATLVLARLQRVNTQFIAAIPATLLDRMQTGVREWTDDESARYGDERVIDPLLSSAVRLASPNRLNIGRSW